MLITHSELHRCRERLRKKKAIENDFNLKFCVDLLSLRHYEFRICRLCLPLNFERIAA